MGPNFKKPCQVYLGQSESCDISSIGNIMLQIINVVRVNRSLEENAHSHSSSFFLEALEQHWQINSITNLWGKKQLGCWDFCWRAFETWLPWSKFLNTILNSGLLSWCPSHLFWTSTREFSCLLVGETSQGRGSEWAVWGSDPPKSYQQIMHSKA